MPSIPSKSWGASKPPVGWRVNAAFAERTQLSGAWLLNEGGGGVLFDSFRPRTTPGAVSTAGWQSGLSGPALNFTGTTQASLQPYQLPAAGWSWVSRMNCNNITNNYISLRQSDFSSSDGWSFTLDNQSTGFAFIKITNTTGGTFTAASTFFRDAVAPLWVTFGASFDGTNMSLYRNGVFQATAAITGTMFLNGASYIVLGDGSLQGHIDYFLGFNSVLEADEMLKLSTTPFYFMQPSPRKPMSQLPSIPAQPWTLIPAIGPILAQ